MSEMPKPMAWVTVGRLSGAVRGLTGPPLSRARPMPARC